MGILAFPAVLYRRFTGPDKSPFTALRFSFRDESHPLRHSGEKACEEIGERSAGVAATCGRHSISLSVTPAKAGVHRKRRNLRSR
jgi:hypothetical protein